MPQMPQNSQRPQKQQTQPKNTNSYAVATETARADAGKPADVGSAREHGYVELEK